MILKLYIFGVDHIFAQWQATNTELVAQLIHHPDNKEILHSNVHCASIYFSMVLSVDIVLILGVMTVITYLHCTVAGR